MKGQVVLILEDSLDRTARFKSVLRATDAEITLKVWGDAFVMVEEVEKWLPRAILISLDHDLYDDSDDAKDLGDGLMVAENLSKREPVCPVNIHSSNADQSIRMRGKLEGSGWKVTNAAAIGDDWIESDWRKVIESLF